MSPRSGRHVWLLTCAALAACPVVCGARAADQSSRETPAAASEDSAAEPAVWTDRETTFVYQGFTTTYSCDGLRDKVKSVLLDLGARKKGLQVSELGCASPYGRPDPFPGVRIKMSVLTPAGSNADAQQWPAASDTRSHTSPGQKPVDAHWVPVDLKFHDTVVPDSGDCELMEQIQQRIVPLFTTRNVELRTQCIPHQATATRPVLKMEVLGITAPAGGDHGRKS